MLKSELWLSFISILILIICVMVSVAFLTLMERKVLGYIQLRKGPNKVGILGVPQPFCDAIKLFSKEQIYPSLSNYLPYYICPILSLFLSLLVWCCLPFVTVIFSFNLGVLFLLSCVCFGVYPVMGAGYFSNSNYALLGGMRAAAQTISYEVSLGLVFLSFIILMEGFNLSELVHYQNNVWFLFLAFPLGCVWLASMMAETNRTPFDFAEGESELVSGFNVEYGSGGFALIFLAEYSSILFMSTLFSLIFLGGDIFSILFFVKVTMISFFFIWIRGTLPRYRYDLLMSLAWKCFLPISLNYLIYFISLKLLIFCLLLNL